MIDRPLVPRPAVRLSPHSTSRSRPAWLLAPALAVALAGCGDQASQVPVASAPTPAVSVVRAQKESVEEQIQFVGRVAAVDRVELQARVQGFLKERRFSEGQQVEAGQVLFVIEPEQYQAIVTQREADLAKAIADEENARAQLERGKELLKQKNIAPSKVDELQAAASIAKAGIAQAKAALDAAKLDLSYTEIRAPVSGRIGLAKFTIGNLVGPSSGTLATIVSRDPIYVKFPVTQRELLEARQAVQAEGGDPGNVVVLARLPNDTLYDRKGKLNFIDVTTDPGTDTVTLRAEFPNPDGYLVDGQYVGVLVQDETPTMQIVIPQSAIQIDQQGSFALVVGADKKVEIRRLRTGAVVGSGLVVEDGLKEGDLVIVEGIQKVRPGMTVDAVPAMDAAAAAAKQREGAAAP